MNSLPQLKRRYRKEVARRPGGFMPVEMADCLDRRTLKAAEVRSIQRDAGFRRMRRKTREVRNSLIRDRAATR